MIRYLLPTMTSLFTLPSSVLSISNVSFTFYGFHPLLSNAYYWKMKFYSLFHYFQFIQVGTNLYGQPRRNSTFETRFGDAVAISSNGLRVAIGASGYDDPGDTVAGLGGNGGLFVYDFNSTSSRWEQSASFVGNRSEGLGLRFAMSSDGSRLVIRHQPNTTNSTIAVYDATTKVRIGNIITGCTFESNAISLSSDGNRVAVSCEKFSTQSPARLSVGKLDIYAWNTSTSTWSSFGSIHGLYPNSLFSYATDFDRSGTRVAVSAVLYDGGLNRTGAVFVYERNESSMTWNQIGNTLTGQNHLDRFGGSVDLSADGKTLAIGAQTHKPVGSATTDGFVQIFEYKNSTWVPKGQIVMGGVGETFGRSVAISDDGSRFAASAALFNNEVGQVRLYEYNLASFSWVQTSEAINGIDAGDRLAYGQKAIALSGDGLSIVVGASAGKANNTSTGYSQVFRLFNFSAPSAAPSMLASMSPSLFPTGSPSLRRAPSTHPSFSLAPTDKNNPTSTKTNDFSNFNSTPNQYSPSTLSPMSYLPPSKSPNNLFSPTSSSDSNTTTTMPTIEMGKFDWFLQRIGPVTVSFSDESKEDEIKLTYSISHRNATVKVYDITCENQVSSALINVSQSRNIDSPSLTQLNVVLDINQAIVRNSNIWTDGQTKAEGLIEICVRVDLVLDNAEKTSVNFHEQKLYMTIGLSQGFTVSQIDLDREAAEEKDEEAQVDYGITSCQCNFDRKCANEVLVQGEILFLCVNAPLDSDIEISDVEQLSLAQGSRIISAVKNSTSDALTDVSLFGKVAFIRTQLPSNLFDRFDPGNLTAVGQVALRFGSGRRRRLRTSFGNFYPGHIVAVHGFPSVESINKKINNRKLLEENKEDQAKFVVRMALAPIEETRKETSHKTGAIVGGIIGGLVGFALVAAIVAKVHRGRKFGHDE
jgi:hypothetical protein